MSIFKRCKGLPAGRQGFTLVEIMIIVAIIALIIAVATPYILKGYQKNNEAAAVKSLRKISASCEAYRYAQAPLTYPPSLKALSQAQPPYIDKALADGTNKGYNFIYILVNPEQFTCKATPIRSGITGTKVFFIDETGIIRLNDAAGAPID